MIHPTAIIDKSAELEPDVEVGPYCVIGPKVRIGRGTKLIANVSIQELSEIGEGCTIYPFAAIGGPPQDIMYKGEDTTCVIGNHNTIREYVTVNRGSKSSGSTIVGSDNFIMAYAHVAHDCRVGSHTIMANCATLAGHVHVDDYAILSGLCAAHQFPLAVWSDAIQQPRHQLPAHGGHIIDIFQAAILAQLQQLAVHLLVRQPAFCRHLKHADGGTGR